MKNYLEMIANSKLDFHHDHEFRGDFVGGNVSVDAMEDELEKQLITGEVAMDQLEEDSVTLESITTSLRSLVKANKPLSRDGFIFASNHIQCLTKKYNIEYSPNVSLESDQLSDQDLSLTIESAELAQESLWQRFTGIVKALYNTTISLIKSLLGLQKKQIEQTKVVVEEVKEKMKEENTNEKAVEVDPQHFHLLNNLFNDEQKEYKLIDMLTLFEKNVKQVNSILVAYDKSVSETLEEALKSSKTYSEIKERFESLLVNEGVIKPASITLLSYQFKITDDLRIAVEEVDHSDSSHSFNGGKIVIDLASLKHVETTLKSLSDSVKTIEKNIQHAHSSWNKIFGNSSITEETKKGIKLLYSRNPTPEFRKAMKDIQKFIVLVNRSITLAKK